MTVTVILNALYNSIISLGLEAKLISCTYLFCSNSTFLTAKLKLLMILLLQNESYIFRNLQYQSIISL